METKIIKVTDKGQVSIPIEIRRSIGINTGDELLAIRNGDTLCLKKIKKDDFKDLIRLTERSLKNFWDNEVDNDIWDNYIK